MFSALLLAAFGYAPARSAVGTSARASVPRSLPAGSYAARQLFDFEDLLEVPGKRLVGGSVFGVGRLDERFAF
jgi:hypothetical protein